MHILYCRWCCPTCHKCITVREGSFFSKSKLSLQKWLVLFYWWARQYPVSDAAEEAKVELNTATAVYQWMREVCSTKLLSTPIKLGGPGVVVQIDESFMHHKPKVCMNSRNMDGLMLTSCVLAFSTTEDKPPAKRSGYLGWWTPVAHQHLASWKSCLVGMQGHAPNYTGPHTTRDDNS